MKVLIFFFGVLVSSITHAETFGIFSSTGDTVKIIVQGNDKDAIDLFDSLNVETIENDDSFIKTAKVESLSTWEIIYEVKCKKSKLVRNLVSCTVGLDKAYSWTSIDNINKSAYVVPYGDLDNFASYSKFNIPEETDLVFQSIDQALTISVERDSSGEIFRFRIDFRQKS